MGEDKNNSIPGELTEEEKARIRKEQFVNNRSSMAWALLGVLIMFLFGFGLIAFLFLFPSMYF